MPGLAFTQHLNCPRGETTPIGSRPHGGNCASAFVRRRSAHREANFEVWSSRRAFQGRPCELQLASGIDQEAGQASPSRASASSRRLQVLNPRLHLSEMSDDGGSWLPRLCLSHRSDEVGSYIATRPLHETWRSLIMMAASRPPNHRNSDDFITHDSASAESSHAPPAPGLTAILRRQKGRVGPLVGLSGFF